jgi:hypothetical protein
VRFWNFRYLTRNRRAEVFWAGACILIFATPAFAAKRCPQTSEIVRSVQEYQNWASALEGVAGGLSEVGRSRLRRFQRDIETNSDRLNVWRSLFSGDSHQTERANRLLHEASENDRLVVLDQELIGNSGVRRTAQEWNELLTLLEDEWLPRSAAAPSPAIEARASAPLSEPPVVQNAVAAPPPEFPALRALRSWIRSGVQPAARLAEQVEFSGPSLELFFTRAQRAVFRDRGHHSLNLPLRVTPDGFGHYRNHIPEVPLSRNTDPSVLARLLRGDRPESVFSDGVTVGQILEALAQCRSPGARCHLRLDPEMPHPRDPSRGGTVNIIASLEYSPAGALPQSPKHRADVLFVICVNPAMGCGANLRGTRLPGEIMTIIPYCGAHMGRIFPGNPPAFIPGISCRH